MLFTACTTMRNNDIVAIYNNRPVPKTLSFDLTTQTLLQIDAFNIDIPDTLVMYRLDMAETIEMINVLKEMQYEESKLTGRVILEYDTVYYNTLPYYYENRHFYVFGKLDLQPNINSIILYDINHKMDYAMLTPYYEETFWLLNFKDNKLLSVVCLDGSSDYSPAATKLIRPITSTLSLKKNVFTKIESVPNYRDFVAKLYCTILSFSQSCFAKTYYTKYKVNKKGYIKFVR